MDKEKIEEYLEKFPIEIRELVMALNTDQKWALFIALTLDKEMYFNEIKKVFKGNANTIDVNLKALVASGLIAKRVKIIADITNQEKTYYYATELGKDFLYNLSEIGLPNTSDKTNYSISKEEEERYKYKSVMKAKLLRNFDISLSDTKRKKFITRTDYASMTSLKENLQTQTKVAV